MPGLQLSRPTPDELAIIDTILTELRRQYHQWLDWHTDPHGMIGFAPGVESPGYTRPPCRANAGENPATPLHRQAHESYRKIAVKVGRRLRD